jgi:predicted membrane metal-binding protein
MAAAGHAIPELDRKGLREFGLVTGAIVAVLFGLFFPWLLDRSWPLWPWIVFGVLGAWGLVAPMSLRPVYRLWIRFGLLMSRITTPLIMGLVFYLAVTPMALGLKILGKDPMRRRLDDSQTYRVPSEKAPPDSLKRPF